MADEYDDLRIPYRDLKEGQRFADCWGVVADFPVIGLVLPLRTAEPVRLDKTDVTLGHPVRVAASGEIWRPLAGRWVTRLGQSRSLRENGYLMVDVIGMPDKPEQVGPEGQGLEPSNPEHEKSDLLRLDLLRFIDRLANSLYLNRQRLMTMAREAGLNVFDPEPGSTPNDRTEVVIRAAFHHEEEISSADVGDWLHKAWRNDLVCGLADDKNALEIIDIEVNQGLSRKEST